MYDRKCKTPLTPEQAELVADNVKLVHWVLNRKGYTRYMEYDDAFSIDCLGLIKAARVYNPESGAFSSIAVLTINQALDHEVRLVSAQKRTAPGNLVYLDQPIRDQKGEMITIGDTIPALEPEYIYDNDLIDRARGILDQNDLLRAYFEGGKTQVQLARDMGIAQSNVSKRIKTQIAVARLSLAN